MTHYTISYKGQNDPDRAAIIDSLQYLSSSLSKRKLFIRGIKNPETTINQLNMIMSMVIGINGYPFHALMRRYRLKDYREWMHSDSNGGPPVMTDERGFQL